MALMNAWKDQARFDPVDLALAEDDSVYSRFLIAPDRNHSTESGGFRYCLRRAGWVLGILATRLPASRLLLGRRNCQAVPARPLPSTRRQRARIFRSQPATQSSGFQMDCQQCGPDNLSDYPVDGFSDTGGIPAAVAFRQIRSGETPGTRSRAYRRGPRQYSAQLGRARILLALGCETGLQASAQQGHR